jgi:hypothetical protein
MTDPSTEPAHDRRGPDRAPGDGEDGSGVPAEAWETAARDAVSEDLRMRADDVRAALYDLADVLWRGEDPTSADVRQARQALDRARAVVEDRAGPVVDGVEPWGQPVMSMPYGAAREHYGTGETDTERDTGTDP